MSTTANDILLKLSFKHQELVIEIEKLKAENKLQLTWVKHHQENAELALERENKLKRENKLLEECRAFYANENNWNDLRENCNLNFQSIIDESDLVTGDVGQIYAGGKARDTAKALKLIRGE